MSSTHHDIQDQIILLWESNYFDEYYNPRKTVCEFYPYTTLKNTIRKRDDRIQIRLSDMLSDAPQEVLLALLIILFCKLESKTLPKSQKRLYKEYVNSEAMRRRIRKKRKERVKKDLVGSLGKHYDLKESFSRINKKYFESELQLPNLSWSKKRTKTRFGHHDEALYTIVISKTLDDPKVPRFLLDYIMYHEALHIRHKTQFKNGRRRMHTREFQADEKKFSQRERAEVLLKKISQGSFR